jgi:putative FmdB family regulatory protein
MPIYDYGCRSCGREFEELVRADTRVACPGCGGGAVDRRLSLPAPPMTAARPMDCSTLGQAPPGGCCGGGCQSPLH